MTKSKSKKEEKVKELLTPLIWKMHCLRCGLAEGHTKECEKESKQYERENKIARKKAEVRRKKKITTLTIGELEDLISSKCSNY